MSEDDKTYLSGERAGASKPPPPLEIRPGTVLKGTYRIETELGSGGMGTVFRATHIGLDKTMAVKVLSRRAIATPDSLARFEREAKVAGKVSHPAMTDVIDFGVEEGTPYIVHGVRERGGAGGPHRAPGPAVSAAGRGGDAADRLAAARGARAGHRPPRPEARQREDAPGDARGQSDLREGARLRRGEGGGGHLRASSPARACSWARQRTWRRSKSTGSRSTGARTCTPRASCSTRCSAASERSRERRSLASSTRRSMIRRRR